MNYETMKLNELRAHARSRGIRGKAAKQPKAELVAALTAMDTQETPASSESKARKTPSKSKLTLAQIVESTWSAVGVKAAVDVLAQTHGVRRESLSTTVADAANSNSPIGKRLRYKWKRDGSVYERIK